MKNMLLHQNELTTNGFTTIENIYSEKEVELLLLKINQADITKESFRKTTALFAIRQFLNEVPDATEIIFNNKMKTIVQQFFGTDYFSVKSIYFDKPETSNWYVAYHQDLTIAVDKKVLLPNFDPWTVKQNLFAVQPPLAILQNNFTIRIHLDDTTEQNGALKVIAKSHLKNIYRPENIDFKTEIEITCEVPKGGVMIMKPLLLHSSKRTTNNKKRRVIHLEFSNTELPEELKWAERLNFNEHIDA
jgi:ectoine hydroxylase-related dioxygenase (phytanoyl-CoA dioxygenase family)